MGWIDCLARGRGLGRGELHRATYVGASAVEDVEASFRVENQTLPGSILMLPKSQLWRLMRPLAFDGGVRAVNAAKYASAVWHDGASYLQSHVAFAFLLDYVPNWQRGLYGVDGGADGGPGSRADPVRARSAADRRRDLRGFVVYRSTCHVCVVRSD